MGPVPFGVVHPRLWLAGLLSIMGVGVLFTSASAQGEAAMDTTTLTVSVNLCIDAGCTESPEAIEPADGVALEISDPGTGDILGACMTGDLEPGACAVEVPLVEAVSILIDEETVPEGYVTDGNPTEMPLDVASGEVPAASFMLYPADGFPADEAPVEEVVTPEAETGGEEGGETIAALPSTGSGSSAGSTAIVLTASTLAMATLGLAVIAVRRLLGRDQP